MKNFFDTSALTKRYIQEEGSNEVSSLAERGDEIYVSIICLPEIFSALNRLKRERLITKKQYRQTAQAIAHDFQGFNVCQLTPGCIKAIIRLLERYPLKAMDAIHLASAIQIKAELFISSDTQQIKAAKKLELDILQV